MTIFLLLALCGVAALLIYLGIDDVLAYRMSKAVSAPVAVATNIAVSVVENRLPGNVSPQLVFNVAADYEFELEGKTQRSSRIWPGRPLMFKTMAEAEKQKYRLLAGVPNVFACKVFGQSRFYLLAYDSWRDVETAVVMLAGGLASLVTGVVLIVMLPY